MAQRRNTGRRRGHWPEWLRGALAAAGLLVAALPAAAQHNSSPGTQVETYSGLRRTDRPASSGPAQRVTTIPSEPETPSRRTDDSWRGDTSRPGLRDRSTQRPSERALLPEPPPLPPRKFEYDPPKPPTPAPKPKAPSAPAAPAPTPATPPVLMPAATDLPRIPDAPPVITPALRHADTPAEPAPVKPAAGTMAPAQSEAQPIIKTAATESVSKTEATKPAVLSSPFAEPESAAPQPLPTAPRSMRVEGAELTQDDMFRIAVWQVICTVCALVLGMLVLLGLALVVLRRMSRGGPLFSVEFVSPFGMPAGFTPIASPIPGLPAPIIKSDAPEPPPHPGTAETFDLGPTYEEEMAMKAEAEKLAQQAVLQQIFDDNVRLREQINADTTDESSSPEAITA